MKLSVSKQELQERLSNIQNIVEKRSTMPILSHFLLDVGEAGCFITATDIETAIREPLEARVERGGRLCIPARKLFEIVREVEGEIAIESEDAQWIKISAGRSGFRLACLAPEEFPSWPVMEGAEELSMDAAALLQMIEKTLYSAGESDTRYTLNGLLFHLVEGNLIVVGTDGHRLAIIRRPMPQPVEEEKKVIVPRKTTSELRKFLEKEEGGVSVLLGKNHILFRVADIEFLARLIEGTYPNYQQVIPEDNDKKLRLQREALVKALRRVSVISRERSNAVKMDIAPSLMSLTSSNPDLGEASDEVPMEYDGDSLSVGYNAKYLLDVLSAMSGETVVVEMKDQLSPTLIMDEGDGDYKCIIMPMRI
jgi:DNA polymerase-3 subunit beta